MRSRAIPVLLVLGLAAQGGGAQTQTTGQTKCRVDAGAVICDTRSQTQPVRPACDIVCALAAARAGSLQGQQEREARDAQAQRDEVEIRRLQSSLDRLSAEQNAADERAAAQRALFNAKARAVVQQAVDSAALPLWQGHQTSESLKAEVGERLRLVWTANPSASAAEIAEAIAPIFADYRQRSGRFGDRFALVLSTTAKRLRVREGSPTYDTLWTALAERAGMVAADDLDAPTERIEIAVRPAVDSAAAALSTRTKPRAKHPN